MSPCLTTTAFKSWTISTKGGETCGVICARMGIFGKTRGIRAGRIVGDVSIYDTSRLEARSTTGPPSHRYEGGGEKTEPSHLRARGSRESDLWSVTSTHHHDGA
jgi:hypothetical protein